MDGTNDSNIPFIPVLLYHRIADLPPGDGQRPYSVTPQSFEQQMKYLFRRGYRSLGPEELLSARRTGRRPHYKCFALTFDDGYLDNYESAFPVLRCYGFKATVFLVSEWLTNGHDAPAAMLSRWHVLEMSRYGITFGAHGRTHRALTGLPPGEVYDEVAGSKQELEHTLEMPVRSFCYPYGLLNRDVEEAVRQSGYEMAFAVHNSADDTFGLHRIEIGPDDGPLAFAWKVSGWPMRIGRKWYTSRLRRVVRRMRGHA